MSRAAHIELPDIVRLGPNRCGGPAVIHLRLTIVSSPRS